MLHNKVWQPSRQCIYMQKKLQSAEIALHKDFRNQHCIDVCADHTVLRKKILAFK